MVNIQFNNRLTNRIRSRYNNKILKLTSNLNQWISKLRVIGINTIRIEIYCTAQTE